LNVVSKQKNEGSEARSKPHFKMHKSSDLGDSDLDDLFEEIGRGFARGIGYIFAEILFKTICYWVGWPLCRLITLGRYPRDRKQILPDTFDTASFFCAALGFFVLVSLALCLAGEFTR